MNNLNIQFNLPITVKNKKEKEMFNFSIITITKNNEDIIRDFISQFSDFIDRGGEVLILDKGSIDNTINIALEMNCRVEDISNFYREVDEDMFNVINSNFNKDDTNNTFIKIGDRYFDHSTAKNYAATLIKNNMILYLNIKSSIVTFNIFELNNYANDYDYIKFDIINKTDVAYEFYNKNKFTWRFLIDELLFSIDSNIKEIDTHNSILVIDHHKNVIDRHYEIKKIVSISIMSYIERENEKFCQSFAIKLFQLGFFASAIEQFNRHLSICTDSIKKSLSLCYIADSYIANDASLAIEYYNKAYIESNKIRMPLYKLGKYYFFVGDWSRCIFYLEGCINIPKITEIENDDFMYNDGPYSMLYVAWWWNGNIKKGKYYYDKTVKISPFNKLYIDEAMYHYKYKTNIIKGYLTFKQLQDLYKESKKYKTILEFFPESGRSTHALLAGTKETVTVIMEKEDDNFRESLDNPGNLRILYMTKDEAKKFIMSGAEKFEMIFINNYDDIITDYSQYLGNLYFENIATKLVCGSKYNKFKSTIDNDFEIHKVKKNIWYKKISSFEKTIIYKRKKI